MRSYRKWTYRILVLSLVAVALVGLINLLVDPYYMHRIIAIPGLTANKLLEISQPRMGKPFVIERLRPECLAFGTSRTAAGIDPEHPGWDAQSGKVFNFGLGGAPITEVAGRFEWAAEHAGFSQAVLGLDFFMFNAYSNNSFAQDRASGEAQSLQAALSPYISSLLTLDALQASITTLRKQDPVKDPGILANGQIAWTFKTRRVSKYGHNSAFQRFEKKFFESTMFPLPDKEYAFANPRKGQDSFESFKKILAIARRDNIDLKLFITPVHARMCEVYSEAGLWELFEDWKRQLVAILAADAAAHPNSPPLMLWDFSGYNSITTEDVPLPGDTETQMAWYWETSHFKKEAGDLVLDRVFAYEHPARQVPEDFGVMIDTSNLDDHLEAIRKSQQDYRREHPQDVAEVVAIGRASTWRSTAQ